MFSGLVGEDIEYEINQQAGFYFYFIKNKAGKNARSQRVFSYTHEKNIKIGFRKPIG
jgi:hypothetical protein